MEVRSIQNVFTPFIHPLFLRQSLTHGTASVAAGIVMDLQMPTVFTYTYVGPISPGLTVNDTVGDLGLLWRRGILIKVFRIKA
jgi:hypothetical protein